MTNYLPLAKQYGASIFTEIEVRSVERSSDGKWIVHCHYLHKNNPFSDISDIRLTADAVVLGAGALGSPEILIRSQQSGMLRLSKTLGTHWSGNGDYLAFAYNSEAHTNVVGWGPKRPDSTNPVGPCIVGLIDVRDHPTTKFVIEDGSPPGAVHYQETIKKKSRKTHFSPLFFFN